MNDTHENNNHSEQQQNAVPQQHAAQPQYAPPPPGAWQHHQPPFPPPPQRPRRRFRNFMKTALTTVSLIRGILVIILIFVIIGLIGSFSFDPSITHAPAIESFSVIRVEGTIIGERAYGDPGYDHHATIRYIRNLAENSLDKGIMLYMNTPGGTVYHADELYLELLDYKAKTGRPIHVYMAEMCASGGYYISMAADHISANRITMTGSIGVITTALDVSELFEDLGIRTVVMDTGEHKGAGSLGTAFTPNQEAVMQSIVDEYYDIFVELIADGRNMNETAVRGLADGRVFTARQALQNGLIDKISSWEEALSDFEALTGVTAHHTYLYTEVPLFGPMFTRLSDIFPKNEVDIAMSGINQLPTGVPLAVAPDLIR